MKKTVSNPYKFSRSTNIIYDLDNNLLLNNLIITNQIVQTIKIVKDIVEQQTSDSAISLVGPYGSGKSTTVVTLIRYLLRNIPYSISKILKKYKIEPLSTDISFEQIHEIVGDRSSLSNAISKALKIRGNIVSKLSQKLSKDENYRCILIIDEFGKYLEYLADNPMSGDIYILQELAELAHHSEGRFILITIRHQAMKSYFNKTSGAILTEWKKVQGRFIEIIHNNTLTETIKILHYYLRKNYKSQQKTPNNIYKSISKSNLINSIEVGSYLSDIYPFNPYTAILLISAFKKFAQNERSIFTFISTVEPYGLTYHLKQSVNPYDISDLFDYIKYNLEPTMLESEYSNQWSKINTTLSLLDSDFSKLEDQELKIVTKVIKTIGLIGIFGKEVNILPTVETISNSLYESVAGNNSLNIKKVLKILEQRLNLISFRKLFQTYHLWQGSDININGLINDKIQEIVGSLNYALELNTHFQQQQIIARKLLIETGAIRYLSCHYVNFDEIGLNLESDADGKILFVVTNKNNKKEIIDRITSLNKNNNDIYIILEFNLIFEDLLLNFTAISRILIENQSLIKDKIARDELLSLQQHYKENIEANTRKLSRKTLRLSLIDASNNTKNIEWNDLNIIASNSLRHYYKSAPIMHNELINHNHLSPNIKTALNKLVFMIIENPHLDKLGMTGHGPEVSIYLNVLKATGIHKKNKDGTSYMLSKPNSSDIGINETWNRMDEIVRSTAKSNRINLFEIERLLFQPPYGVKKGLAKVLIFAFISSELQNISIYQSNSFVPKIYLDTSERMLRNPKNFDIQYIPTGGIHQSLFKRISEHLFDNKKDTITLLDIVTPLVQFANRLPKYTKRTQSLSSTSRQVLTKLLTANSPEELIYNSLPEAIGLYKSNRIENRNNNYREYVDNYTTRLSNVINEIRDKRNNLFVECELQFLIIWGANYTKLGQLRKFLVTEINSNVCELITHEKLRAFANRIKDKNSDDRHWLESIAAYLADKPMDNWIDADFIVFLAELKLRVRQIRELQKLSISTINANLNINEIKKTEEKINSFIDTLQIPSEYKIQVISRIYNSLIEKLEDDK